LNAALRLVQQSLEKSAAIATAIQQKQTEIARLKKRDNFMLIGLVVAAIRPVVAVPIPLRVDAHGERGG